MRLIVPSRVAVALQYLLAVLLVALTTGLLVLFHPYLSIQVIALILLLPVLLSARLWGLGPGILAAIGAFLFLNFFFIQPLFTFAVNALQDLLSLIVFLVNAVVISQMLGHDRQSLGAATAREREATQLYELSTSLAGLLDEQSIAGVLAQKICETFFANRVEIVLLGSPLGARHVCSGEEVTPAPAPSGDAEAAVSAAVAPSLVYPLASARGEPGKALIWRHERPFSESERRLLSTFTSQGALALERARLVESERRSGVLEESDRLKSALLSSVSHELRSPLATIKASISSLRSGEVEWSSEARPELLAAIEEETDHLNQLVGNLLDMSRIETGSLKPQRKWNSLAEIAAGVLKRMGPALQRHRLRLEFPPDFPPAPVDYVLLEQVFVNLLSNSSKYAPSETEIVVRARTQPGPQALVQVINQGPPVAEADLDRIFDKFYRVTAADRITGTGLGLSICKGIVELHGGRIWAENAPGRFIFNFTLPLTLEGMLPEIPKEEPDDPPHPGN
jgi:two-component system, OmpR family, sensor histidine kinase KdpD